MEVIVWYIFVEILLPLSKDNSVRITKMVDVMNVGRVGKIRAYSYAIRASQTQIFMTVAIYAMYIKWRPLIRSSKQIERTKNVQIHNFCVFDGIMGLLMHCKTFFI